MTCVHIEELTYNVSPYMNYFQVVTAAKPHHIHTF